MLAMHEVFDDLFFSSTSNEDESGELEIIDLDVSSKSELSESGVPSSPTESDESEDSRISEQKLKSFLLESLPTPMPTPSVNSNTSFPNPINLSYTTPVTPATSTYVPNVDHLSQYLLNQYICQQVLSSRFNAFNQPLSNFNTNAAMQFGRNIFYNPLSQMQFLPMQFQNAMQIPTVSVPVQLPIYPMSGFSMYEPPNQTIQSFPLQNSSPIKSTGINCPTAANPVSGGNRASGKLTVINCTGNGNSTSTEQDNDGNELVNNTRKRRASSSKRPTRNVRPKVIPEKGSIQCKGTNRKKNKRCRNAALMEFIGPRPIYCAEHIQLDPNCLYTKCKSTYQKVPGDKKGCREVVLKEFGLCHKHYNDVVKKMKGLEGYQLVIEKLIRVSELLNNLEDEALKAKKTDADLFQRKNKLIPKFHEIRSILKKRLCELYIEGFVVQPSVIPEIYFQDTEAIIPLTILQSIQKPNEVHVIPLDEILATETVTEETESEETSSPVSEIERALEL